ncbi:MAG: hypothetical protein HYY18_17100 [Planctomycetes bacterium]|nr:hypothetical protein [Planctomycetota bacterium]
MEPIKMTSKRQVTFPRSLCEELKLTPGCRIQLVRRVVRGRVEYVLVPPEPDWSWVGAARKYAKGKSHRWSDIEKSISRGMGRESGR